MSFGIKDGDLSLPDMDHFLRLMAGLDVLGLRRSLQHDSDDLIAGSILKGMAGKNAGKFFCRQDKDGNGLATLGEESLSSMSVMALTGVSLEKTTLPLAR